MGRIVDANFNLRSGVVRSKGIAPSAGDGLHAQLILAPFDNISEFGPLGFDLTLAHTHLEPTTAHGAHAFEVWEELTQTQHALVTSFGSHTADPSLVPDGLELVTSFGSHVVAESTPLTHAALASTATTPSHELSAELVHTRLESTATTPSHELSAELVHTRLESTATTPAHVTEHELLHTSLASTEAFGSHTMVTTAFPQFTSESSEADGVQAPRVTYTASVGDLVIITMGTNSTVNSEPAGWTLLGSELDRIYAYARIIDGTEANPYIDFDLTAGGPDTRAEAFTIEAGTFGSGKLEHVISVSSASDISATTNPNPPAVTRLDNHEHLFIVVARHSDVINAAPTNYSNLVLHSATPTPVYFATATRELESTTDDPGTFGAAGFDQWQAMTIAVSPAVYTAPSAAPEFGGITSYNYSGKSLSGSADGTQFTTLPDRHSGADATDTASAHRTKTTVSGEPVISFAGGSGQALTALAATAGTPATIFVVARWAAGASQGAVIDGTTSTERNVLYTVSGTNLSMFAGANLGTSTDPRGFFASWRCEVAGASSEIYQNGVLDGGPGNPGAQVLSSGITIGSFYSNSSLFFGELCEIVIYDGALDAAQTAAVEAWLAAEWSSLL